MQEITQAIENYKTALLAFSQSQRDEVTAKDRAKKARYAVISARRELRDLEQETLEANVGDL